MDFNKRYENLISRRKGDFVTKSLFEETSKLASEEKSEFYETMTGSKLLRYAIGAMLPVDEEYTNNTFKEGERVKNQLENNLSDVQFAFQGSVTNNTHIKRYSDIDLLTLCDKFYTYTKPATPSFEYGGNPYKGDPLQDLINLRERSIEILNNNFPTVTIDNSGAKSIALEGGSLKRKVDVVPSNWYHTKEYQRTREKYHIGVQILDYHNKKRLLNTPFYHNELLRLKDNVTSNNFKKVVRLLKTLKADADENIKFSSYDITGIIYHMPEDNFLVNDSYLLLIKEAFEFLCNVTENHVYLKSLYVPDGSRKIISSESEISELNKLKSEVKVLYFSIIEELKTTNQSIEKVAYKLTESRSTFF